MRLNHRGVHITVPQHFLDRANVVPIFQEMCGKPMAKRVARNPFGDAREMDRLSPMCAGAIVREPWEDR